MATSTRLVHRLPVLVLIAGMGALAMFIPASYASAMGDHRLAAIFAMSGAISMVLIALTGIACATTLHGDTTRSVLLTLVGTFLALPVMLAVPFLFALPDTGLFNAWWEMVSSLTTTGASLYSPEKLPEALNLWRGIVGWLGGFFILVAALAIMAPQKIGGFEIMTARYGERDDRRVAQSSPAYQQGLTDSTGRMVRAAREVFPIYAGLTLALWMILLMMGESGLFALMRAMGTLSTSGISPVSGSTGHATGIPGEIAVFIFLIPALSRRFWPGGGELVASESWGTDPELRLAAMIVLTVAVVLFSRHFISAIEIDADRGDDLFKRLGDAASAGWGGLFNAMSYLTTTGWNSVEWQGARSWSGITSPGLLLAGLAIMGGGVATAAGGVKLLRVYALIVHSQREMEKVIHPNSVAGGGRIGRRLIAEGGFLAFVFFMLFALSLALVLTLISLQGIEFESGTILSIAAVTNTGQLASAIPLTPSFQGSAGVAGAPWAGWAGLPDFTKAILAGGMVLGRVETLAILSLFNPELWRR